MENTESLNLRWDDFEANTCVALKELREEKDFGDVTLATDGKQVSAHKVILAGGSKFFQQILKQNPHPHPLLYLKGVKYEYLLSMLDFVYTGEANIDEKEIQSFLQVANDLQIKGLIEKNPSRKLSDKERETIPSKVSHEDQFSDAEALSHDKPGSKSTCEEGTIDASFDANIKVEMDDIIHSTVSFGTEANHAGLNDREDVMDFKTEVPNSFEIGSISKKGQMTADSYEQSEDFSDDALRANSGKLTPVFTSPDELLACEQKSDLLVPLHQPEIKEDSFFERDDFSGFDDKDCDMTGREPVDSPTGLNVGDMAYAMHQNDQQEFKKCTVIGKEINAQGSTYQIRFEGSQTKSRTSSTTSTMSGTQLAYFEPTKSKLSEGTRCIAIFCEDPDDPGKFFPGVVAQSPNDFNDNRYLIFFDDGYNAYWPRENIREMVETMAEVWKDGPCDPEFIQNYLEQFPNYPVLNLGVDEVVETSLREDEVWVMARVLEVDASLVKMDFGDDYEPEWMYVGSPRFKLLSDNYNVKNEVIDEPSEPPKTKKRIRTWRKCTGRGGKLPRQEIKNKPLRKTFNTQSKMLNEALELEDDNF